MQLTTDRVIDDLGGTSKVAGDLRVRKNTVSSWRERGIPPSRWPALVALAARCGCEDITWESLAALREM